MPTYEYRCNACKRKVSLTYKTYAEFDEATPTCTFCGGVELTRLISRVAIHRSVVSRLMSDNLDDDTALDALEHSDPRTLGRVLREMGTEMGEDMGGEFEEVVERLERGESPDEIEASLPDLPDTDSSGGAMPVLGDD